MDVVTRIIVGIIRDKTEVFYVDVTIPLIVQTRVIFPHQTGSSQGTRFPVITKY